MQIISLKIALSGNIDAITDNSLTPKTSNPYQQRNRFKTAISTSNLNLVHKPCIAINMHFIEIFIPSFWLILPKPIIH